MQVASSDLGQTHSIRGGATFGNVVKTGDRANLSERYLSFGPRNAKHWRRVSNSGLKLNLILLLQIFNLCLHN